MWWVLGYSTWIVDFSFNECPVNKMCAMISPAGGGGRPGVPADERRLPHITKCASVLVSQQAKPGHSALTEVWAGM